MMVQLLKGLTVAIVFVIAVKSVKETKEREGKRNDALT
jgi:hypothetical protein